MAVELCAAKLKVRSAISRTRRTTMAVIALPLFSRDVNSVDDPRVRELVTILKGMADAYGGKLTSIAIDHGVVLIGVQGEELVGDMLPDLERLTGSPVETAAD